MNQRETQLQAIVVRILGIGKRVAPDRFPRFEVVPGELDYELIRDWVDIIRVVRYPLTPEEELHLWEEATRAWVRDIDHDRMVTAGEVLRSARVMWGRWNEDLERKAEFDRRREVLSEQRDLAIESGEFGKQLGYKPRAIENAGREVPGFVQDQIERMKRRKKI